MKPQNRLFIFGVKMENRDLNEVSVEAAMKIDQRMD